jgi:hypothetical protein
LRFIYNLIYWLLKFGFSAASLKLRRRLDEVAPRPYLFLQALPAETKGSNKCRRAKTRIPDHKSANSKISIPGAV